MTFHLNAGKRNNFVFQVLAAETMAIIAQVRKARKQIRIRSGIPLIVSNLLFVYV